MTVEKVKANDLPTTPAQAARTNGLLASLSGPVDMVELKQALFALGGKIKHVGGALPPLFPEKGVREGDARLVSYLGYEIVPEERSGGGGAFTVLNLDVHDHTKKTLPAEYRAQMIFNAVLETYFGAKKAKDLGDKKILEMAGDGELAIPTREPEKTPLLIITFAGTNPAKKTGFSPTKRWIIEEYTPPKA